MQCTSSIPKETQRSKSKMIPPAPKKQDIGVQRILATKYHESGAEKRQQQQHKHNNNSKGPENIAEHSRAQQQHSTAQHSTAQQTRAAQQITAQGRTVASKQNSGTVRSIETARKQK